VPVYTADALVLRTYKLGDADRIVVFLTRDRGKKRGVAKGARRTRSRFSGALEPLTRVSITYFEKERRDLVSVNSVETARSPLASRSADALTHVGYFADLIDQWAPEADPNERLYRLGAAVVDALTSGAPAAVVARYFEYWLLRLQGVYPPHASCHQCGGTFGVAGAYLPADDRALLCDHCAPGPEGQHLSAGALEFLQAAARMSPLAIASSVIPPLALQELEAIHRGLISTHLEKSLKSVQVLRDISQS